MFRSDPIAKMEQYFALSSLYGAINILMIPKDRLMDTESKLGLLKIIHRGLQLKSSSKSNSIHFEACHQWDWTQDNLERREQLSVQTSIKMLALLPLPGQEKKRKSTYLRSNFPH